MKTLLAVLVVVSGTALSQAQQTGPNNPAARSAECADAAARDRVSASQNGQTLRHTVKITDTGSTRRCTSGGDCDDAGIAITEEGGPNQHADRPRPKGTAMPDPGGPRNPSSQAGQTLRAASAGGSATATDPPGRPTCAERQNHNFKIEIDGVASDS